MSRKVVVLDVVGLTPRLLPHMPNLAKLGSAVPLEPVLPAVTCSVQSTLLTGETPAGHGIVGNGWYFRELGEVLLWRQHNALVGGEKVWQAARRVEPGYTVANVCWWYAMGADVDWTVTPRPIYYADGRKEPDCYTFPPELHDELHDALGPFPLFTYWGPSAGIPSSTWIARAAQHIMQSKDPDLTLVYLPHLDYDLQRYGPDDPRAAAAAAELDAVLGPLLDSAREQRRTIVALSEYGITSVSHPVDINRLLRTEGWLNVHTQDGMEYLDPWTSRAFAVADHQIAHVYVQHAHDVPAVRKLCESLSGVSEVRDGLGHVRAGELVLLAEPDAWFTYYYWLDDKRAPDFAQLVEIHRKPGYDPAELLFDPAGPGAAKARAGLALLRKKLGFRYRMSAIGLDAGARAIRGSHGLLPTDPADGPVWLCDDPAFNPTSVRATDVKRLLLNLADLTPATGDART
ncbi:alkaline phosphatase family protein [Dactylosporangium vinaceum]|uniref:Nucleotide pyrophosphatase/phosphodiesterase family protein n=1 Tax=Dactylosporangium vinaceum TaxID=53362 RepID=A0ABV5MMY1_9ACTN|nr:nucleotide pyrophosphatase/phosphodiesterase family protein [Dactylosporangium vinaceum]UAB98617.1 alkaline phosphatase family protein [Dactylosporangium vinaceum]